MIFVDTTHTAHCYANTGIQRVTRRIARELGTGGRPVVYDRYGNYWRTPDSSESALVSYAATVQGGSKRSANWSLWQQVRGHAVGLGLHSRYALGARASGLIVPEIFAAPRTPDVYADIRKRVDGPAIALFHDLIPLLMPAHTPTETVAKFETYLAALRNFDAIAAISEFSRDVLLDYWRGRGESHPPVYAIPLGVDAPPVTCPVPKSIPGRRPVVLCVGTLEGRKNHLALLEASESLWSAGLDFELTLFGGLNRETALPAENLAQDLIRRGRPLRRLSGGSDVQMEAEYERADFTVYPSLMEGFGLPVWESLARGRPCVCSGENAMAETTRFGGCLTSGHPTSAALAGALRALIQDPQKLETLRDECLRLKIRTWSDYATDLRALIATLRG